jgi:hypothetical protein
MGALQRVEKSARQIQIAEYAVVETGALEAIVEGGKLAAAIAAGPPGLALYALSAAADPAVQGAVTAGSLALQTANDVAQSELMREAKNEQAGIKRAIDEMKGDLQGVRQEVGRLATACADLRECVCELRQHNRKIADALEQFVEVARQGFTRPGVEVTTTLGADVRGQIGYHNQNGLYYRIGTFQWLYQGKVIAQEYIHSLEQTFISPSHKIVSWRINSLFRSALQTREIKIGPGNAPAPGAPPSGGGTPTKPSLNA